MKLHTIFGTLFVITACATGSIADAGEPLTKPAMKWADHSRLGRPFSKDPCVIYFNGTNYLYFSLPPYSNTLAPKNAPAGWSIGIATSKDLIKWQKIGELLPEQSCERNGICAPGCIVLNGKVHMFYQTYGNGTNDAICHATSVDGIKFVRDTTNPIFRPSGSWTCGRAIDADVIEHEGKLLLYYATRDPFMKTQMIGVAGAVMQTGDEAFSRNAWKQLFDGPILKPELPWERKCIEAPSLIKYGSFLYMFYAGAYNNEPQQIGVAMSKDGIQWRRISDQPFLTNGGAGEWNSSESGHPGIFSDPNGRTLLFFQGNSDKGRTWYLSHVEILWENNAPRLKMPNKF